MSTFEYIQKMKKGIKPLKEALRTPSVKTATVQVVSYSAATTIGEEIARRFKTTMLPQITNLCGETENLYNMYSSSHEDEEGVNKQKKELKPVEDLYNALQKAQDVILGFVARRKKELTNEAVEAAAPPEMGMDDEEGAETSGVERLLTVIKEIANRDDLARILQNIEDVDSMADELENAVNTYETSLEQDVERKEY